MDSFGRYRIDRRIGIGGMGEVFAARAVGAEGFERPIAVKVILPELCDDVDFQKMFVDEAKISMFLQHANIVQVLDLGAVDGRYFLAMEMVEGPNLQRVLKLLQKRGALLPVPLAVYVCIETLKGLDYAHNAKDRAGTPLSIVHRDVTPQNILLSVAGEVKLSDFGIARAATRVQRTQTGVVRGKLFYIAPEQFEATAVTGPWTDVYACGMVLLTSLLGKNPLEGSKEQDVIERLRRGDVPVPALDEKMPPGLHAVIAKALASSVLDRYHSAAEFQEALEEFVLRNHIRTGARYLAEFLQQLATQEAAAQGINFSTSHDGQHPTVQTPSSAGKPANTQSLDIVLGQLLDDGFSPPAAPAPATVSIGGTRPPDAIASSTLHSRPRALPTPPLMFSIAGALLIVVAAFFAGRGLRDSASSPLTPVALAHGGERPRDATIGWLDFDPYPWAECSVDGAPIGTSPVVGHTLPPGKHTLEFRSADGRQGTKTFEIRAGRSTYVR